LRARLQHAEEALELVGLDPRNERDLADAVLEEEEGEGVVAALGLVDLGVAEVDVILVDPHDEPLVLLPEPRELRPELLDEAPADRVVLVVELIRPEGLAERDEESSHPSTAVRSSSHSCPSVAAPAAGVPCSVTKRPPQSSE
jgi:hypothetical protein